MQIIILGMHRSGTSMVTRLVNMMGASVGPTEMVGGPASDNVKGFWERSDVRDLNDEMLAASGAAWDNPAPFVADRERGESAPEQIEAIRRILFGLDAHRPWVLKDPRLCLTFGAWRAELEAPVCILALRHPFQVAGSLAKRNALPTALSLAMWEQYTISALRQLQGLPLIRVRYERLLEDPEAAVSKLYDGLIDAGCTGLRLPATGELKAFINPDLNHQPTPLARIAHPAISLFETLASGQGAADAEVPELSHGSFELLQWHAAQRKQQRALEEQVARLQLASDQSADAPGLEMQAAAERANAQLAFEQQLSLEVQARERAELNARQWQQACGGLEQRLDAINDQLDALQQSLDTVVELRREESDQISGEREGRLREVAAVLALQHEDLQQLRRWLSTALELMQASFMSARWRLGDRIVRVLERLMLRGRPRLARDDIEKIANSFEAWGQSNPGASAQGLHPRGAMGGSAFDAAEGHRSKLRIGQSGATFIDAASLATTVPPKLDGQRHDVICFPVIDWHFRMQRPQHLARVLGARGHRVFYLTTHPACGCRSNGFELLESPSENVWLVRLRIRRTRCPNPYRDRLRGVDLKDLIEALDAFRSAFDIHAPIALVDLPFWRPLVEAIPGASMIYDCMDHHAGFSTNSAGMLREEESLLRAADEVIVTSAWLAAKLRPVRPVHLVPNGVEVERFSHASSEPAEPAVRPIVGYVGAISDWFDVALVAAAATELREVDFVLVGDVTHPDVTALRALENVQLVGEVPYDRAAPFVHRFDVCTIPFLITDLTLATNPVKAYEYLAAGKPVVATAMPELQKMDGLIRIAESTGDFIRHLRDALAETPATGLAQRRRDWASLHDWQRRGEAIEEIVRQRMPRASIVVLTWNNLTFTRACLESIEQYTDYPDWELVLVDNASSDGTVDYLREYASTRSHVRLVLNEANLGFAAGNNVGIKAASGEVIVLLNNDTFVTPGWLSGLIGHLMRNPQIGIVGPVTNNIGNEARINIDYGDMQQMQARSRAWTRTHARQLTMTEVVAFFCCALPRAVVDTVGLLDEEFGQGFFEDDDYCNRIRASGRKVAIADDVFVHHHLSASFSTLKQEQRDHLFTRNKAIYERKWGQWKPHRYRAGVE